MDHLCYFCLLFVMISHLFIAALWSPAGKGLVIWFAFVIFNCAFVTFQCGILGQLWYLILSIPDRCCLSYFYNLGINLRTSFEHTLLGVTFKKWNSNFGMLV